MKKLLTILTVLFMATINLKAQESPILYTDFEPDLCIEELSPYDSHDTLKIDLDQDGTIDFKMYIKAHYSTQVRYVYVTSSWDFRYCYNSIYSYGYMDENDSIIPNHPFWAEANDTWELLWYPDQYMEFIMGFRKTVNDDIYYAWAKIYMYRNLNGNGYQPGPGVFDIVSAYCDDMAYCTIPNYPLRWEQTEIETPSPSPIVPDLYTIGYKDNNSATRTAKLYKNNALLHSIRVTGKQITPYKIANDSEGNIYWMVVYSANSSTLQTEIWKNDELYLSTEGHNDVTIKDLYCLGDTLFYVGNTTTEEGIKVATVWRGPDFTPHWVLGNGLYDSFIYDADVDKNTNIPYFCGYITDSLKKASVWEASQLLYKQEPWGSQRASWASEISIDNGSIFTNGYLNYDNGFEIISMPTIWKDNERISNFSPLEFINCLYAYQDDYYFTFYYPHGMYYGVLKNGHELLQLSLNQNIQRIYGSFDDIYMVGKSDNKGSIWKNLELLSQHNDCDVIIDILALESTDVNTTFDEPTDNGYRVYPNPTNGILFVETQHATSLPAKTEYRITNLMGQSLLQGHITAEKQQINIDNLPAGLYFITIAGETQKFVIE